ncbi:hypothetical protein KC352_g73 [Hortaea werneckii]|nr:hypothetical protein KC352_g73 [Hortaea werneckii]
MPRLEVTFNVKHECRTQHSVPLQPTVTGVEHSTVAASSSAASFAADGTLSRCDGTIQHLQPQQKSRVIARASFDRDAGATSSGRPSHALKYTGLLCITAELIPDKLSFIRWSNCHCILLSSFVVAAVGIQFQLRAFELRKSSRSSVAMRLISQLRLASCCGNGNNQASNTIEPSSCSPIVKSAADSSAATISHDSRARHLVLRADTSIMRHSIRSRRKLSRSK